MMNKKTDPSVWPIGVFDSGIGGLTLVQALKRILPHESIVYFGDTAHLPYGEKSPALIGEYSQAITQFLMRQPCKAIVVACHTASAVAFDVLKERFGHEVPLFNVVDPVVATLKTHWRHNQNLKCGFIGTHRTVLSGIYPQKLASLGLSFPWVALPTPLLVPLLEFSGSDALLELALSDYLGAPELSDINTLVLGCTHYPLLQDRVEAFYQARSREVKLIDPSSVCAVDVQQFLHQKGWLRSMPLETPTEIYLSDMSPWFTSSVARWLTAPCHIQLGILDPAPHRSEWV